MLGFVTTFSVRRPLLVIAAWLVAVAGAFATGVGVFDRLVSDVGAVPGSESERAWTALGALAPPESVRLTAVIEGCCTSTSAPDPTRSGRRAPSPSGCAGSRRRGWCWRADR